MSDFDPNVEPETDEQMDRYLVWCADNFARVFGHHLRTYRTGVRCAHWLLTISASQLRLDADVEETRDALQAQLDMYAKLARALERQREHFAIERLIVLRSSLDCWLPVGRHAGVMLDAAKAAVAALMLIELHPMVDLWDLPCPEVWSMIDCAAEALSRIEEETELDDYTVAPDEMVIAKFTWQRAQNVTRRAGFNTDLNPN